MENSNEKGKKGCTCRIDPDNKTGKNSCKADRTPAKNADKTDKKFKQPDNK